MTTRAILCCLFLSGSLSLSAQIGFSAAASTIKASDWQTTYQEEYDFFANKRALFLSGYNLGINYWFRLKKKRVEFFPTLSYSKHETLHDIEEDFVFTDLLVFQTSFAGLHFDTRIYPFDFGSDCDCPVWSKQNDILKKGFYVMLSPGIDRVETRLDESKNADWLATVSAGVGLDIGISDFLTVTPFLTGRYTPEVDGDNLFTNKALGDDFADVWRLMAGLHIGFRLENEYRRRR